MSAIAVSIVVVVIVLLVAAAVLVPVTLLVLIDDSDSNSNSTEGTQEPVPEQKNAGWYVHAAVAADAPICSTVGKSILKKNGSAVDAAVATQICQGVVNFQASGLGGGGFMIIYNSSTGTAEAINMRETAPKNAFEKLLLQKNEGPTLLTGIPGELQGLHMAWKKYGKLPWYVLLQPSIELAENGFTVTKALALSIESEKDQILKNESFWSLRQLLAPDGELPKEGDIIKRPVLGKTLRMIAREGPDVFYKGNLTSKLVKEINEAGGNVTEDDFNSYEAISTPPLLGKFKDMTVFGVPPPCSGAVLQLILSILDLFNMTPSDYGLLSYQRTIEAFKFAFAQRTHLADPAFVPIVKQQVQFMMNSTTASWMKGLINDNATHPWEYYDIDIHNDMDNTTHGISKEMGTCHTSVIDQEGNAVAMTTTVNTAFGSLVRSNSTGIIFNDIMLDFSTPNQTDYWDLPPNEYNFIKPGKRPQSSTAPTIFVDSSGQVKMVTGASGGTRIASTVALIASRYFLFNIGLKNATDMKRAHHQFRPKYLFLETGFPREIEEGLEKIGHIVNKTQYAKKVFSASQSIIQDANSGLLYAVSDKRKGGIADGF
jgi:gamma-glutamyltranspeptidase/glutathione hydrolase/leukotriene-C4 hydrolase